tara:strand:+ start:117 stop:269 length:153 start_codon:yes stop_codon:yes gene_type:complete
MGTNFSNQTTDNVLEHYEFRIQALTSKLRKIKEIIDTDGNINEIYKLYEE